MYIKRYSVVALALIAFVGWYVFAFITHESMSIDFFGIHLPSLAIATWIIIPLGVLFLASVAHMMFYSILGGFKLRKYEKDYAKMIDAIVLAYLGKKDREHTYKTERYQVMGALIDNSTLFPTHNLANNTPNEKINNVIKIIEDIKKGEVVDLKQYSLLSTNQLVIQNERNRYKKGDITAENILGNQSKYDEVLLQEVFLDFIKTASLNNIEKYKSFFKKEALFIFLERINAKDNTLEVSNESLLSLMKDIKLDKKEYIQISSSLSQSMIPEQRMKLFESLSNENEDVVDAYLYTLFDLELLTPADEILENTEQDEYLNFKAYRALKECNKHFNINLFV